MGAKERLSSTGKKSLFLITPLCIVLFSPKYRKSQPVQTIPNFTQCAQKVGYPTSILRNIGWNTCNILLRIRRNKLQQIFPIENMFTEPKYRKSLNLHVQSL